MQTRDKRPEHNANSWSMNDNWNASKFIAYIRDTKETYKDNGWPNGHQIRTGEYYNAVVVFGDTDLNRSRERARVAAGYDAFYYVLLGTIREQVAIGDELSKAGVSSDKIVATHGSKDTEGNIEKLKELGLPDPKLKVLVISHAPHAERLMKNFLRSDVEYHAIPETSMRRIIEHKLLSFLDNRIRSGKLADVRESVKNSVEK